MADNLIQVGVKFDGSQLQAGMREATAAVSQAASEMKAQFSAVAEAAKRAGRDKMEAVDEELRGEVERARQSEQMQEQLIEQQFLKGQITKQQEIAMIAKAKQDEIQQELQYFNLMKTLWDGDAKKVQEIQNKINQLVRQGALVQTKAVTDGLKAQDREYQKLFNSISSTFKSTIAGLLQGHETIAQAFQKLYTGLLQDLINYEARKLEVKAASWIKDHILHITRNSMAIDAEAAKGGAAAAADSMELGPAGLAAAPAVASGAVAMIQGFKALLLETGAWNIPGIMPAILHPGEMVVPAFPASLIRNAFQGGNMGNSRSDRGGGITVIVNHSVNAVDAESFQSVVRRHSNIIGNEVVRVLKKKGFSAR